MSDSTKRHLELATEVVEAAETKLNEAKDRWMEAWWEDYKDTQLGINTQLMQTAADAAQVAKQLR
jgi:hypothetical protein